MGVCVTIACNNNLLQNMHIYKYLSHTMNISTSSHPIPHTYTHTHTHTYTHTHTHTHTQHAHSGKPGRTGTVPETYTHLK